MTAAEGSWEPLPSTWAPVDAPVVGRARVVPSGSRVEGVGAYCDLVTTTGDARSFAVSEFLTLTGGVRLTVATGWGFTLSWGSDQVDRSTTPTAADVVTLVLNTVLPDDDESNEEHRWDELAAGARGHGVEVTVSHLRTLSYEVILAPRVGALIGPATG